MSPSPLPLPADHEQLELFPNPAARIDRILLELQRIDAFAEQHWTVLQWLIERTNLFPKRDRRKESEYMRVRTQLINARLTRR